MKKNITVLLLLGCLSFLIGCFPVRQLIVDEFTSPTCVFEYDGSKNNIFSEIKKELAHYDFLVFPNDDRETAMLVTEIRKLHYDEYYDISLFFTDTVKFLMETPKETSGGKSVKESGRLVFIFNEANNATRIELFVKVFIEMDVYTTEIAQIPFEHPLLYKFYGIISKLPNIKVIQAPPEQKEKPVKRNGLSPSKPPVEPPAKPSSYTPIIVIGGIGVLAILIRLIF